VKEFGSAYWRQLSAFIAVLLYLYRYQGEMECVPSSFSFFAAGIPVLDIVSEDWYKSFKIDLETGDIVQDKAWKSRFRSIGASKSSNNEINFETDEKVKKFVRESLMCL